jgi:hypothetical protein
MSSTSRQHWEYAELIERELDEAQINEYERDEDVTLPRPCFAWTLLTSAEPNEFPDTPLFEALTEIGAEGWELVCDYHDQRRPERRHVLLFKRPRVGHDLGGSTALE